ncbi:hypothetical protein LR48_Vigan10g154800 [Vigna angularis]|uniref:Uncharacterized protein n=1 Tax=Phaseolus angularis TaxID=3914 RepID=A0A0L9VKR5_PHAAN|nr:hypothetical protein LR48_Vigan10g154800 [Vigna angularis]
MFIQPIEKDLAPLTLVVISTTLENAHSTRTQSKPGPNENTIGSKGSLQCGERLSTFQPKIERFRELEI